MSSFQMQWCEVLRYGLILSLGFTAAVLLSYWVEPLAWAGDFPPEVRAQLGPIPARAQQVGVAVFVTILVLLITVPAALGHRLRRAGGHQAAPKSLLVHTFMALMVLNFWDFLIIDVFIFSVLSPDFMMISEAKSWLLENVTLRFHLQAFLIGVPIMAAMALPATALALLTSRLSPG